MLPPAFWRYDTSNHAQIVPDGIGEATGHLGSSGGRLAIGELLSFDGEWPDQVVPRRFPVGRGDVCLSNRGRMEERRQGRIDLGPLRSHPWDDARRRHG